MGISQDVRELNIKATILNYILDEVGGIDNIKEVEENAGSIWIDMKDGSTKSIMIIDTESNEAELD